MAHVTAVGSPNRAETAVFWVVFDVFGPILAIFVVGEKLGDLKTSSRALKYSINII